MNLPPLDIWIIWSLATAAAIISFILYAFKMRRNRMVRKKKEEEEMGGDVVSVEEPKKKVNPLSIRFGKKKEEEPKEEVKPDETIEFEEEEKKPEPEQQPEPEQTVTVHEELMLIAERLALISNHMAPPETEEQRKIRELEEQLQALKK